MKTRYMVAVLVALVITGVTAVGFGHNRLGGGLCAFSGVALFTLFGGTMLVDNALLYRFGARAFAYSGLLVTGMWSVLSLLLSPMAPGAALVTIPTGTIGGLMASLHLYKAHRNTTFPKNCGHPEALQVGELECINCRSED